MAGKEKQSTDAEGVLTVSAGLRKRANAIQALATVMEQAEIEAIDVTNTRMVERGMKAVDNFILSCKRELGEI
ncbi:MAG: hypothetical protein AAGF31_02715 [Planctomycetota bacterium]